MLRNPKYVERYEDVVFNLETPLTFPGNTHTQKKDNYRIVVDHSGEVTPFDWYNGRFDVSFKVDKKADGTNIAIADKRSTVNGASLFVTRHPKQNDSVFSQNKTLFNHEGDAWGLNVTKYFAGAGANFRFRSQRKSDSSSNTLPL